MYFYFGFYNGNIINEQRQQQQQQNKEKNLG